MSVGKRLRLERLGEHHDVSGFASGNTELDKWLQHHALAAQAMNSARTFVLLRDDTVVGYFSLTLASVRREDAPTRLVRGLPAYPVGMVLVARLAVAAAEQGAGLGAGLLSAALRRRLTPARSQPPDSSSSTPSTTQPPRSTDDTASPPSLRTRCGSTGA